MPVIHIKKHENNFVQIDKRPLSDDRLSWKAKGIWVYLMSKPPNWKVFTEDLIKRSTDGEHSVRAAIKELIHYGYAERRVIRGDDGKIARWDFYIYEEVIIHPALVSEIDDLPDCDFPQLADPELANLPLNKNEVNKNDGNKNYLKTLSPSGDGSGENFSFHQEADFFTDLVSGQASTRATATPKKKNEMALVGEQLEPVFAAARGCDLPDWGKDPKVIMKRWRKPLFRYYEKAGKDLDLTERGIMAVVAKMRKDNLTFDAPDQIEKNFNSWMIDHKPASDNHQLRTVWIIDPVTQKPTEVTI